MIIAVCEHCRGIWDVRPGADPQALAGECMSCQEGGVDRPLAFGLLLLPYEHTGIPKLPEGWLRR